jgi:hypothetical protein
MPFGERHFRHALAEFVAHYHGERNHQGLRNELIDGQPAADVGRIVGANGSADCSTTTREPRKKFDSGLRRNNGTLRDNSRRRMQNVRGDSSAGVISASSAN